MFRVPTLGLALALATASPIALVAVSTPAVAQQLSQAVGKPLQDAMAAAKKRQTAVATAKIEEARKAAKTDFEKKKVGEAAAYVYTSTGQFAAAAKELEAVGATPNQIAPLYYQAGQYQKAVQVASKSTSADMQLIVAQSYVKLNQHAQAASAYKKLIASGGPKKQYLEGLAGAQYRAGDKEGYLKTVEQLIRVDPSPANWKALLYNLRGEQMPPAAKLGLYLLIDATGNLDSVTEYNEYVQLAATNGAPGLGYQAMKAGIEKGKLPNDARTQNTLKGVETRASQAQAQVAKMAASKNPADLLTAGKTYYGLGQYDVAAATFAKAGSTPEALLLKGIAQVRAGQAAAAKATLAQVKGKGFEEVASLWSLYSSTKKAA
ncbi:tetratricopeptide repeat protein [Pedomonas sp. V897]|uniref:tetratricopeptide repeat protein n=1 Tax=Pedomonas sp. V897 TaxID=3446482 RepID=UPI003EE2D121